MAAPRANDSPLTNLPVKPTFSPPPSISKPLAKSVSKPMPPSPLAALAPGPPLKKPPVRTALQFQPATALKAAAASPPAPPALPKLVIKAELGSAPAAPAVTQHNTPSAPPNGSSAALMAKDFSKEPPLQVVSMGVSGPNRMTALELEEARKNRTPYKCNKCGQPKRGHVCTLALSQSSMSGTSFLGSALPVPDEPEPAACEPARADLPSPSKAPPAASAAFVVAAAALAAATGTDAAAPAAVKPAPAGQATSAADGSTKASAPSVNRSSSIQSAGISATTFYTNWFDMAMSNLEILRSNLRSAEKLRVWDRYGECICTVADSLYKLKELRDSLSTTLNEMKEKDPSFMPMDVPLPAPPPKLTNEIPQMSTSPLKKTQPVVVPINRSHKKRRPAIPGSDDSFEKTKPKATARSRRRDDKAKDKEDVLSPPPSKRRTRKPQATAAAAAADELSFHSLSSTSNGDSSADDSDARAAAEGMMSIQSSQKSAVDEASDETHQAGGGSQPVQSSQQSSVGVPVKDPATQYTPVVTGSQELDALARVSPASLEPVELPVLPTLRKENSIGNTGSQLSQLSDIDLDNTPEL